MFALLSTATNGNASNAIRRKLKPESNIAQEIRNEHAQGNSHLKFTLVGEVDRRPDRNQRHRQRAGIFDSKAKNDVFAVHVHEIGPAVTSETTISVFNGPRELVGDLGNTILVADIDSSDPSSEEDGTIAIISIDKVTEEVNGIVQKKDGTKMKFTQKRGMRAKASEAEKFTPPAWKCGILNEQEEEQDNAEQRFLSDLDLEVTHDIHEEHDHEHDHEEHEHHHHHNEKIEQAFADLSNNLRGSKIQMGKRRKLKTAGNYNYQVDIYVEVDQKLFEKNGKSLENTINYVNVMFLEPTPYMK